MNLSLEPQEQTTVGRRIMGVLLQSPGCFRRHRETAQVAPPLVIVSIISFLFIGIYSQA